MMTQLLFQKCIIVSYLMSILAYYKFQNLPFDIMHIVQKRLLKKLDFVFNENEVIYSITDHETKRTSPIDYVQINFDQSSEIVTTHAELKKAVLIMNLVLIMMGMVVTNHDDAHTVPVLLLIVFGFILIMAASIYKTTYTILRTDSGNLLVMHNNEHDLVIEQLKTHKNKRLRSLFAKIDPSRSIEGELQKFNWLLKSSVIDETEFERFKAILISSRYSSAETTH